MFCYNSQMTCEIDKGITQIVAPTESHEQLLIPPEVTMKPHHYFNPYIQKALIGDDPHHLAMDHGIQLYKASRLGPLYYQDALGDKSPEVTQQLIAKLERYYQTLGTLPDKYVVRFGLSRDGICNAMVTGNHCMAINYNDGDTVLAQSLLDTESQFTDCIIADLINVGAKPGIDYRSAPSTVLVKDFKGRGLTEEEDLELVEVDFQDLIVTAKALRKATRKRMQKGKESKYGGRFRFFKYKRD